MDLRIYGNQTALPLVDTFNKALVAAFMHCATSRGLVGSSSPGVQVRCDRVTIYNGAVTHATTVATLTHCHCHHIKPANTLADLADTIINYSFVSFLG